MSRVRFLACVFDVILIRPGYTSIIAQLLSVPPYAAAALLTVAVGFIADRTRQRGITNMLISLIGIVGFALMMGAKSAGAKYAGTFLGAMGIYPTISNTISWCTNNTEGERHIFCFFHTFHILKVLQACTKRVSLWVLSLAGETSTGLSPRTSTVTRIHPCIILAMVLLSHTSFYFCLVDPWRSTFCFGRRIASASVGSVTAGCRA